MTELIHRTDGRRLVSLTLGLFLEFNELTRQLPKLLTIFYHYKKINRNQYLLVLNFLFSFLEGRMAAPLNTRPEPHSPHPIPPKIMIHKRFPTLSRLWELTHSPGNPTNCTLFWPPFNMGLNSFKVVSLIMCWQLKAASFIK